MPNTLAHVGIQGWISHRAFKGMDLRWVLLGLVIPDVPWILQRLMRGFLPGVDPYDLRAYVLIQASFFGCLLLCAAAAVFSEKTKQVFSVLSVNVLLHLLLDAAQIKWAGGVHLFAPFNWKTIQFGWFWPEAWPSWVLTAAGVVFLGTSWKYLPKTALNLRWRTPRWRAAAVLFLSAYFLTPFLFLSEPYAADNHFLRTLRNKVKRSGRSIEVDRNRLRVAPGGPVLETAFNETIRLAGNLPNRPASVSLQGVFMDEQTLYVHRYHIHRPFRDWFSYAGLGGIFLVWCASFYRNRREAAR